MLCNHPNGSIWLVNGHGEEVLDWWFLGSLMAIFGFWQLSQGILEGAFHEMYVSGATNLLSLSSCIGFASGLLGMAVCYWVFVPWLNDLIAKGKYKQEEL